MLGIPYPLLVLTRSGEHSYVRWVNQAYLIKIDLRIQRTPQIARKQAYNMYIINKTILLGCMNLVLSQWRLPAT